MCVHNLGYNVDTHAENNRYWVCLSSSSVDKKEELDRNFQQRMYRCRMLQHCEGMESTLPYMKGEL